MTNVFFHCANEEHEFAAKRGVAIDNLVEACEHAHRIVTPAPGAPARMPFWHG